MIYTGDQILESWWFQWAGHVEMETEVWKLPLEMLNEMEW
jgi:hypothetical protein